MMFLRVLTARDWPCVSNVRLIHRMLKQHSVPRVIETAKFPDRTAFLRLLMILQPAERANVACHLRARSCTLPVPSLFPAQKDDLTFARQVREYEPGDLRGEGHLPVAGEGRSGRSKYYDGTGHCGALT